MENKLKYIVLILMPILLLGCGINDVKTLSKYEILNKDLGISGYLEIETRDSLNYIVNIIKRYNRDKVLKNNRKETYLINNNTLISLDGSLQLYANKKDKCYDYKSSTDNNFQSCFIGFVQLEIGDKTFYKVKKFLISEKEVDGISRYEYYDDNFNLLRSEYNDGPLNYFRIEKVD
jgi:hypothetical protein